MVPTGRVSTWDVGAIGQYKLTRDNDDFALDSGAVGIWRNLLELWNVFEIALVWNRGHQLLAQGGKPSFCNGCHDGFLDEI